MHLDLFHKPRLVQRSKPVEYPYNLHEIHESIEFGFEEVKDGAERQKSDHIDQLKFGEEVGHSFICCHVIGVPLHPVFERQIDKEIALIKDMLNEHRLDLRVFHVVHKRGKIRVAKRRNKAQNDGL